MHICVYICIYMYVYISLSLYIYIYICMYVCIYIYIYIYIHIIHMYTHVLFSCCSKSRPWNLDHTNLSDENGRTNTQQLLPSTQH